jgi:dinuclear metal center YbgI/SA1388 family protein
MELPMPFVTREQLGEHLDTVLEPARFKDYCPNGLQVEGSGTIRRIVTGVTASQALLDEAVRRGADAIVVHHGYFWRGEDGCVTGIRRRRLATLLAHDINLFAYHLPLDAHPELGNNAVMGRALGWQVEGRFGEQDLGCIGRPNDRGDTQTADAITRRIAGVLGREPMVVGDPDRPVRRIAWCTGGAQSWFEQAIAAGADCFVSGEISEQTVHLARESGVVYMAAGHHATERFGVRALGEYLQTQLGVETIFVDIDNPV